MKALVYHGPNAISWEEKPVPSIQNPSDVIVRISKTTLCGTDSVSYTHLTLPTSDLV